MPRSGIFLRGPVSYYVPDKRFLATLPHVCPRHGEGCSQRGGGGNGMRFPGDHGDMWPREGEMRYAHYECGLRIEVRQA